MGIKRTNRNKKAVNTKVANSNSPANPETPKPKTSKKQARAARRNGKLGGRPTTRTKPAKNKQFLLTLDAIEYVKKQVENGTASNGSEFVEGLIAKHKKENSTTTKK